MMAVKNILQRDINFDDLLFGSKFKTFENPYWDPDCT